MLKYVLNFLGPMIYYAYLSNWKGGIERDKFIPNMLISQNILCKIMAKLSM